MASWRHSSAIGSIALGLLLLVGLPGVALATDSTVHPAMVSHTVTARVGGSVTDGVGVTPLPTSTDVSSGGSGAAPFVPLVLAVCGMETLMLLALRRPLHR